MGRQIDFSDFLLPICSMQPMIEEYNENQDEKILENYLLLTVPSDYRPVTNGKFGSLFLPSCPSSLFRSFFSMEQSSSPLKHNSATICLDLKMSFQ